ncbi:aliphatic sulfonate ABC transporter substrate-binding protein [Ammoniphilus resinae]|uniref:Taurine transport system substrate-binding protein n=1 Tax=Ammoniphilus resinae TaxID=861532 RepID=A0ABS4GW73_9BACL|nr:aliphatic sulfonate ABC transporter substrate-binding protein [Ammoniphilus resinae]MBP1934496.1 taurine transport system substrate-binding protein [Ammoniphilus resinae]
MSKVIRKFFLLGVLLVLALAGAGCGKQSEDAVVNIGYQVIPNTEAIVKSKGWHEETIQGMEVKWHSFDSGRDVNTALASGSIDIGLLGSTLVANGISEGLDYQVIWIADVIGANEALVVKKDSGINSMEDLKGKKIAVTFGSTTQYTLLSGLKANGIDPGEVNILDMQPPDMLAAWTRGDIDGGYVWHPTLQKMVDDQGQILITSGDLVEKGIVTADVIVVRNEFAKQHPEVVKEYIASQIRAVELYRDNPEEAIAAVSKEFNIGQEEAGTMMKELIWLSAEEQASSQYLGATNQPGKFAAVLEDTAHFLKNQSLIKSVPSPDAFHKAVSGEYIEKVTNE